MIEIIKEFEHMKNTAELNALSTVSLDRPLHDDEFDRMMVLKEKVFG